MVPALVVPSPQSHTAVCVSALPGSLTGALAFTAVVTASGSVGAVIGPTLAATLVTVTSAVYSRSPPSLSRSLPFTARFPLSAVGQLALAVGRSGRSDGPRASLGVVSSAGGPLRTWRGGRLERYVQTDATPYPGISGGALADARGNVLGVLTTGLSRGAALAIPANLAWRVAGTLSERGSLKRGYLGILSQPVRLPDAQGAGLTQRGGLLVVGVEEGSPAGRGGVIIGDIVAMLDGQPVEDTEDLLVLLAGERVGRPVPVKVIRGGEPKTLEVTVGERG